MTAASGVGPSAVPPAVAEVATGAGRTGTFRAHHDDFFAAADVLCLLVVRLSSCLRCCTLHVGTRGTWRLGLVAGLGLLVENTPPRPTAPRNDVAERTDVGDALSWAWDGLGCFGSRCAILEKRVGDCSFPLALEGRRMLRWPPPLRGALNRLAWVAFTCFTCAWTRNRRRSFLRVSDRATCGEVQVVDVAGSTRRPRSTMRYDVFAILLYACQHLTSRYNINRTRQPQIQTASRSWAHLLLDVVKSRSGQARVD